MRAEKLGGDLALPKVLRLAVAAPRLSDWACRCVHAARAPGPRRSPPSRPAWRVPGACNIDNPTLAPLSKLLIAGSGEMDASRSRRQDELRWRPGFAPPRQSYRKADQYGRFRSVLRKVADIGIRQIRRRALPDDAAVTNPRASFRLGAPPDESPRRIKSINRPGAAAGGKRCVAQFTC